MLRFTIESFPGTRIRPWTSIFIRQVTGFSQLFIMVSADNRANSPDTTTIPWYCLGYRVALRKEVPCESQRCRSATRKSVQAGDGHALYLLKKPSGTRLWRMNYTHMGRQKTLSSGEWPPISLAEAREKRDEARRRLAAGLAPSEGRKLEQMRVEERARGAIRRHAREAPLVPQQGLPDARQSSNHAHWPAGSAFGAPSHRRCKAPGGCVASSATCSAPLLPRPALIGMQLPICAARW